MGKGSFPGVKCGRGLLLTTHPLLVPRSWKSRAIPLPIIWATPGLKWYHFNFIFISRNSSSSIQVLITGRNISVGIATRYGLDGLGFDSRWVARISAPVQTGRVTHPASYIIGTMSFPGVKWPGRDVDQPPTSSTEVERRVELYVCYPSLPSWPVLG